MIKAISFWKKPVLSMTPQDLTKFINQACIDNKNVAYGLYFQKGLRGPVTDEFIKKQAPHMFKADGTLSVRHKKILSGMLKNLDLPEDARMIHFYRASEGKALK